MESNFFENINKMLTGLLICCLILSGGAPISGIVLKPLEKYYGVELPTYNIGRLISTVDNLSEIATYEALLRDSKTKIDNANKFLDLLETRKINYIPIISKDKNVSKFRIETIQNVNRLENLLSSISTDSNIVIETSFLNEQEAIVSIKY